VAERLRDRSLRVEIDTRGRSVKGNLQYAVKRGIPFAVVVGSEERAASAVVLKHMESREEQRMGVDDAIEHIRRPR
jgi:histidyl-tRNA synthetase